MRKEYNNRLDAPLVNPAFTIGEYEAATPAAKALQPNRDADLISQFEGMLQARDAEQAGYWDQVRARSERAGN